jgi:pSer/pThr/pTyr-binding forkhead associated (FHA) protein
VETPFLLFSDSEGEEHRLVLNAGALTVGRRDEADLSLPWDPEVSRLHCELELKAGVWTIADDGLSQNGTFVNGIKVGGRRRLRDGDMVQVGKTTLTFCQPGRRGTIVTLVPGALAAIGQLSDQQRRVIAALCSGEEDPLDDAEISAVTGVPEDQVHVELLALARAFGLDDVPEEEWRPELAALARHTGML